MAGSIVRQSRSVGSAFDALREKVRRTLLEGQAKIERARVETYWQTGKHIHEYILKDKSRSDHYGTQLLAKLSEALDVDETLLNRTLKFYRSNPKIPATWQESLSWSHYRQLLTVHDEAARISLRDRAAKGKWTARTLAEKIREEVRPEKSKPKENGRPASSPVVKLIPKLGELYTYQLAATEQIHGRPSAPLQVDVGFQNHYLLTAEECKGFRAGEIVESVKDADGNYSLKKSARKKSSLFTYKASIERVVDGDTLIVVLDLGFRMGARHYLRLRNLNCQELGGEAGRRTKGFVERAIKDADYLLITSTRPDKYGRFLADLHVPLKSGEVLFLNQRLLDEGLAVYVK